MTTPNSTNTEPLWSAVVSGRLLLAVAPFRASFDEGFVRFNIHGVLIEPHPAGGVLLIATDGHVMGVLYDRTGHATGPMTVQLPDALIDACKPPKLRALWQEGEEVTPDPPAWMEPDKVFLTTVGCFVAPLDKNAPGMLYSQGAETSNVYRPDDFRLLVGTKRKSLDWRMIIPAGPLSLETPLNFDPIILSKFQAVSELCGDNPGLVIFGSPDPEKAIVIRCREFPDFWGCAMAMRPPHDAPDAFPSWLSSQPCLSGCRIRTP